jgi:hypothetical protein
MRKLGGMDALLDPRHTLFKFAFDLGETVYLKTDDGQYPRLLKAYRITTKGTEYELWSGTDVSFHEAYEIQREPNLDPFFGIEDEE